MSHCASSASSCAASSAAMSAATTAAISAAALSSSHRDDYYGDEDDDSGSEDTFYGSINVNLKGTKLEEEKAEGWFKKIFVGDKEWEEEIVTQTEYLKKIYDVFSELGYKNVLYVDVNGTTVYEDSENTDNDFEVAIQKALEQEIEPSEYNVAISLDTTGDEEENILVTMQSSHDVGEYPLTVEVTANEDPKELLDKIGAKLDEHFETEEVEIEGSEDSDEEDEEEGEESEEGDGEEDESEDEEAQN